MNFTQFLLILRARYRIILATLAIVMAVTVIVTLLLPKTYRATASLVLNYKGIDPVTGLTLPSQLLPGYMATQIDIINSRVVALRVVDDLRLAENPAMQAQYAAMEGEKGTIQEWLAGMILSGLEVVPARESSILDISYRGTDPQFAAAAANAFSKAYQQVNLQLKIEPAQRASGYFTAQLKTLRENLEKSQNRLSAYQEKNGIVSAENSTDVESARLNELSSQLVAAQAASMEAGSRQRQAQSSNASPDVMSNPMVQSLKISLANAEAKFAETSERVGANHPQYQAAKSEVDKLRSNLNEQLQIATSSIAGNARILQQREAEIRAALATQRAKVMGLNGARDELKVLTNEMQSAQRAYEAANLRFSQTSLEGQSNQSDISVLSPALVPLSISSPKMLLNCLIGFFLGTLLGLGLAILAELSNRRIRSAEDLVTAFNAPVLGVVEGLSPSHRRSLFSSRGLQHNLN
jgi:succinoglycan biosynthesis transport protein ExoP